MPTNTPPTPAPSQRSTSLRLYAAIVLALWTLSALPFIPGLKALWPTSPLWMQPPFYDFGCFFERLKLLHQPAFWTTPGITWDYPAPCIFVYQLFYAFNRPTTGEHKVFFGFLAYLLFAAIVLLFAGYQFLRAMRRRGISTLHAALFLTISLPLCWPIYFSLQRGNIDFFLDAGIALGLWAYVQRKWWLFALIVGLFGAGKLYPLILLSLLLPLKRWKELALGLAAAVGITAFATHWIGTAPPTDAQTHGIANGLIHWFRTNSLTLELNRIGFDHSLFGALKLLNIDTPQRFALCAAICAITGSIAMLVLFFTRLWRLPRPNQLLAVTLAALLLPPTSFDYTLLLLLPAWAWITLISLQPQRNTKAILCTLAAFAFLFAPEAFAYAHGIFFAAQLKMLCLLALLLLTATVPIPEPLAPQ